MSAEEITSSVETIEIEAEKMLEEARNRASEIILKAKEEANRMLTSEMSLNEVKKECEQILDKAREKADQDAEEGKKEASRIKINAEKKVGKIMERIVNIVTGVDLK